MWGVTYITPCFSTFVYTYFIMELAVMQEQPVTERRKHLRVKRLGLAVRLGGKTYVTNDWSMGGFMLADYNGKLSTGALVTVSGVGRSSRKMHTVELPARVVRNGEFSIAVTFLSLDFEAYEFLQQFMCDNGDMRNLLDS